MKYFTTDYLVNKSNFESDGFKVFAYSQFNYPLLCIHALIEDSTPAPLEKLDKAIAKLSTQNYSSETIHTMLGLPKRIIDSRIDELLELGLLLEQTEGFALSNEGKAIFLEGKQQIYRRRTFDFYLDGISLQPLTKDFYKRRTYQYFIIEKEPSFYIDYKGNLRVDKNFFPDIPHTPPSLDAVKENVFEISPEAREQYNIPLGIVDISKISYTKIIYPVLIAHRSDETGNKNNIIFDGYQHIYKDSEDFITFNGNLKEKVNNVSAELTRREIEGEVRYYFNTNWDEIDRYADNKSLIIASDEDLGSALSSRYHLELEPENIEVSSCSIRIVVDNRLFRRSTKKLKILNNLERGSDYFRPSGSVHCIFLEFHTEEKYLKDLIAINELLSQYEGSEKLGRIIDEYDYPKKQVLCDLERFVELETLNITEYFITETA